MQHSSFFSYVIIFFFFRSFSTKTWISRLKALVQKAGYRLSFNVVNWQEYYKWNSITKWVSWISGVRLKNVQVKQNKLMYFKKWIPLPELPLLFFLSWPDEAAVWERRIHPNELQYHWKWFKSVYNVRKAETQIQHNAKHKESTKGTTITVSPFTTLCFSN